MDDRPLRMERKIVGTCRSTCPSGVGPCQSGGATGKEIMALAEAVVASVKEKFGIDIHPEVNYI